jgi:hypothetical protein
MIETAGLEKPKVALLFDRPYVDAHPCFREMVENFALHGWRVDLLMVTAPTHPLPGFNSVMIRILPFQKSRSGLLRVLSHLLSRSYTLVVATPQWSLYWAIWARRWGGFKVVCLSDEIYLDEESRTSTQKKWKSREMRAHQTADFTVSLSETRMLSAMQENLLRPDHPYSIIPNAPSGQASRASGCYYRDRFSIPTDRGILVHSGTLNWRLAAQLASFAANWAESWAVVFQGRFHGANGQCIPGRSVYYEERVFPAGQMREITSSADMGLALYDRDHPLERRNGETPGKLGLYLSCALPVICGNVDSLRWVEEEKCGAWVNDVSEIPAAAARIRANYQSYCQNAARVFNERFEYSSHFNSFLLKLQDTILSSPILDRRSQEM